jgi:hypothetical protein
LPGAIPLKTAPYFEGRFQPHGRALEREGTDEAVEWSKQTALKSGGTTALSIMAVNLARQGRSEDLKAWLAANPRAPGREGIKNAVGGEGRARE